MRKDELTKDKKPSGLIKTGKGDSTLTPYKNSNFKNLDVSRFKNYLKSSDKKVNCTNEKEISISRFNENEDTSNKNIKKIQNVKIRIKFKDYSNINSFYYKDLVVGGYKKIFKFIGDRFKIRQKKYFNVKVKEESNKIKQIGYLNITPEEKSIDQSLGTSKLSDSKFKVNNKNQSVRHQKKITINKSVSQNKEILKINSSYFIRLLNILNIRIKLKRDIVALKNIVNMHSPQFEDQDTKHIAIESEKPINMIKHKNKEIISERFSLVSLKKFNYKDLKLKIYQLNRKTNFRQRVIIIIFLIILFLIVKLINLII